MTVIKRKYISDDEKLLSEWNWERNTNILPQNTTINSGKKVWWTCPSGHDYQACVSSRTQGTGCPYCSGRKAILGYNDLKTMYPEIAKEWDYEKNYPLTPELIKPKSNKTIWWICKNGHSYKTAVYHRMRGDGCPYCSNHKVIPGYNDLKTVRPDLAREWHPNKNGVVTPDTVSPNGDFRAWWQCPICGYEWQVRINSRRECPNCSSKSMTSFPEQAICFYI